MGGIKQRRLFVFVRAMLTIIPSLLHPVPAGAIVALNNGFYVFTDH
jgi:hypothetical protein